MKRHQILLFGIVLLWMSGAVWGQIGQLETENDFSPERISLTFNAAQEGAAASGLFDAYGVRIRGLGGGRPTVRGALIGGQPFGFLSNEAGVGEGVTSELVIDFREPVRQVGFLLKNGSPGTMARFTFRNVRGENIGVIQTPVEDDFGPFVGFEAPSGQSFSRIVLNYGDSPNPEEFAQLLFTYVTRSPFTIYFPQIADGALPGGGSLRTNILLANLSNTTATGQLLLFGDDGQPLELTLDGESGSVFNFAIPANSVQPYSTSGASSTPVQGYACVNSDVPVGGVAIFQAVDAQGAPVTEAGVESTSGRSLLTAAVARRMEGLLDSGVAVANVGDQPASGIMQLLDANGNVVSTNADFLQLGPNEHTAGFLPQFFEGLSPDFTGTLLIFSNQPLAVTVLRTANEIVLSSLPVASTER